MNNNVVRMRQGGFLVGTPQWHKALSIGQCVSIGTAAAVDGLKILYMVSIDFHREFLILGKIQDGSQDGRHLE